MKPKYVFVDPSKSMKENIERSIRVEELVEKALKEENEK